MERARYCVAGLVVCVCLAGVALSRRSSTPGKVVALRPFTVAGWNGSHHILSDAQFRLDSRQSTMHRVLRRFSLGYAPGWSFMVLTNNHEGGFVAAFRPDVWEFSLPALERGEFFMRGDERLLYTKWKLRVTRSAKHQLPRPLSALLPNITTGPEIWVSDTISPLLDESRWERPSEPGISRQPGIGFKPGDAQRFHTNNNGTLFGGYQFELKPEVPGSTIVKKQLFMDGTVGRSE